jgi:hypothetical protein
VRATAFEEGKPVGPLRVWPGGLAVSRSMGDRDGKKGGVISIPEVGRVLIPDTQPGARLLLASDGRALQLEPIIPMLKAHGNKRLTL